MAASGSLDSLITKHAAEFAEHVRTAATMASSEMDVQVEAATQLRFLEKNAGIKLTPRHNATIGEGRPDSVYHRVIVEYKNPNDPGAKIGPTLDSPGTKKVVEQIKSRFRDLQTELGYPINSLLGVGCDGFRFVFVRWRDTQWDVQPPVDVDRHSAERFLWAVSNLGQKGKPYKPEYLAQDFGSAEGSLALKGIPVLYDAIRNAKSPKAQTFFKQWKILFGEVCGYDVEDPSEKMKKLADGYGIPGKVQSAELLFAVHTYYAIFMKLLAAGIVAKFHNMPGDPLSKLHAAATQAKFKAEMEELEKGSVFRHFNITNFLEGDLFLWYLSEWSDEVFAFLKAMVGKLDEYVPQTLAEEPTVSRDLLKKLYQELFPKKVRHDLGEYYTPDWLAEHTLNEVGYDGNPDKRVLDPSCGSGTFLVMAINRIRAWYDANRETAGYEEADLARKILSNCIGFDLNPLAVMAARTNYLIAIRGLINGLDKVEIPVYLCDSILTPSTYGGLFVGDLHAAKELKTAAAKFIVPTEIAQNREDVTTYAEALETSVKLGDTPKEFIERCAAEGLPVTKSELHTGLYKELVSLDKANKNGVWARIIKNSFAPLFVGKVDFIVGNPPWVNIENLPREYLNEIDSQWTKYGLKHTLAGPQIGSSKRDICSLFVYACADYYLVNGGRLGFVLTQSLFKSKGGGDGFRRFRYEDGTTIVYLQPKVVYDLSDCNVFAGAVNRTAVLVVERSLASFEFPVRYFIWRPTGDPNIAEGISLEEVRKGVHQDVLEANPSEPGRPTSPWLTLRTAAVAAIVKVRGKSAYRAYTGVYTGGLNGAYWITEVGHRGKSATYTNLYAVGKKPVPEITSALEPEFIFPLVRGRDVKRWAWTSHANVIIPWDRDAEDWVSEVTMRAKFPKMYQYFLEFKTHLLKRKTAIVQQQMKRGPFYAMVAVGTYTFSPWKVLYKRLSNAIQAVVVPGNVMPHEKLVLLACNSEGEAHYLAGILNSDPVNVLLRGSAVRVQTIEYSPSDIAKIALPRFDSKNPLHVAVSRAAKKCATAASAGDAAAQSLAEAASNQAVANLFGVKAKDLDIVAKELIYLQSGANAGITEGDD